MISMTIHEHCAFIARTVVGDGCTEAERNIAVLISEAILADADRTHSELDELDMWLAKHNVFKPRLVMNLVTRSEAEHLAQRFHEIYEGLAPSFGYHTRKASRLPWSEVPAKNRALMIAVCATLFQEWSLTSHDEK